MPKRFNLHFNIICYTVILFKLTLITYVLHSNRGGQCPVCGEDGKTYENFCIANCEKVKMKCEGRCPCPTGCKGLCERSHYWQDQGPVCGEDGKTYENFCIAYCEKVKIKCEGKCPCSKKHVSNKGGRTTNTKENEEN